MTSALNAQEVSNMAWSFAIQLTHHSQASTFEALKHLLVEKLCHSTWLFVNLKSML